MSAASVIALAVLVIAALAIPRPGVAEKFDYDAGKLRQVRAEVDAATTAACQRERERMLGALKTKSLAEALS